MWEEAAALDPGDDPALRSFHDEGVRSLEKGIETHLVTGGRVLYQVLPGIRDTQ